MSRSKPVNTPARGVPAWSWAVKVLTEAEAAQPDGHAAFLVYRNLHKLAARAGHPSSSLLGAAGLRCWAFSPPGGLVSRALLRVMDKWTNSVVVGKDAVPRASVNNLSRLMDEMVTALARCR